MAADLRKAFGTKDQELRCPHPRLVLETKPDGYLTGKYVCEECGEKFSRRTKEP
jgi:DNA-directed RNA polymerase subunit RPC12/RpoP